jgi:SAM-dependent methyltransferase
MKAAYSGSDNLEVMQDAVNYNAFLVGLLRAHVQGAHRILDFGAGRGTFAVPLKLSGADVTCVEPDESLRGMLAGHGLAAVESLERIASASFDFIFTLNVLEHIRDDAATLRALREKLRPGGRLLVYVPAFQLLYSSMDRKVGHVRRYRRERLAALASTCGLTVETVRYADSLGFAAALLYKLLDDETGNVGRGGLRFYDRFVFPLSRTLDRVLGRFVGKNLVLVARR